MNTPDTNPTLAGGDFPKSHACWRCGHQWIHGMDGSHDCIERVTEQRDKAITAIEDLKGVVYAEANRLANHCSDGAALWAMKNLYDAANAARAVIEKVSNAKGQP